MEIYKYDLKSVSIYQRLQMAVGKGYNIVEYFYKDKRQNKQYLHVLRDYRDILVDLLSDMWLQAQCHPKTDESDLIMKCYNKVKPVFEPMIKILGDVSLSQKKIIEKIDKVLSGFSRSELDTLITELGHEELPF